MFLYQKLGYEVKFLTSIFDFLEIKEDLIKSDCKWTAFDTETTGLNEISDKPFLYSFGYDKKIFLFDAEVSMIKTMIDTLSQKPLSFAHNAKFDYHMTWNKLGYEDETLKNIIACCITIARLVSYTDDDDNISKLSLQALGERYIDPTSKHAVDVIKNSLSNIKKRWKLEVQEEFKKLYPDTKFQPLYDFVISEKIIQFAVYSEEIEWIRKQRLIPNYEDVYKENKELMRSYAADDVVILLEYLKLAMQRVEKADPTGTVLARERKLISITANMEKEGLLVDIPYLFESKKKVEDYRESLYSSFTKIAGDISVSQHKEILKIFEKYGLSGINSTDKKTLKDVLKLPNLNPTIEEMIKLIQKLRRVDTWLSTYIIGKINKVQNGKIHTSINNSGTVTGRVSCNMHQQPKDALYNDDNIELFHPRRVFIAPKDKLMVFIDASQMELRVQAQYTINVGKADKALCRAYIPYECINIKDGRIFDYNNENDLKQWNSGEWNFKEDMFMPWIPTDVHTETTFKAFPYLNNDKNHADFKKLRYLGKMCNFLKNYMGGLGAIMEQLDVEENTAELLDKAYYQAFPQVRAYQDWVMDTAAKQGYAESMYNRRFFIQNPRYNYKLGNYLIQGSCADMIKDSEVKIAQVLKGKKSKMILPVHDEIIFYIDYSELYLIELIQTIMQHVKDKLPNIPMIADIEYTQKSWADKEDWKGLEF